jgi:hypothetical protein
LLKTSSHLTATEAEAWCVQEMSVLDLNGIAANQKLWAQMDIRAEEESDSRLFSRTDITDAGINLNGLIELFAKPSRATQARWTLKEGPVTLEQLRRGG